MINAMVWIARSGAPWRDLPERYGFWKTVYSRFRKWIGDGILDNISKHRIGEQTVDNFNFLFTIDFRPMIIAPFDFFNEALV